MVVNGVEEVLVVAGFDLSADGWHDADLSWLVRDDLPVFALK